VESAPGKGTTLAVCLPAWEGGEPAHQAPAAPKAARGTETILLVEDEDMLRGLTAELLTGLGYRVLSAAGPQEALRLEAGCADPIHLLLTDVIMPGMNGLALANQVHARRPGMRRLFMSGYPEDVVANHGLLGGDLPFIQKPFTEDDLALTIRSVLHAPVKG
jgi:two-component system, cell cycle sensor histidine kinase and response regulator CckA